MLLNKTKWFTLIMVMLLAVLQVLQPFIHAHLDGHHPVENIGFHVGDEHEASFVTSNGHSVSVSSHVSHIVSVASAIKQDIDPALLMDVIDFVLLTLCFAIVLKPLTQYCPQLVFIPPKFSSRRLPAPRAPPQF